VVSAASRDVRGRVEVGGARLRRDRWNLLEDARPGWAWKGWIRVAYRTPSGLDLTLLARSEVGDAGWSTKAAEAGITWYF